MLLRAATVILSPLLRIRYDAADAITRYVSMLWPRHADYATR